MSTNQLIFNGICALFILILISNIIGFFRNRDDNKVEHYRIDSQERIKKFKIEQELQHGVKSE